MDLLDDRVPDELEVLRLTGALLQDGVALEVDRGRGEEQGHDDEGRRLVLLDTRNREEVRHGTFEGAATLPIDRFSDLPVKIAELSPGTSSIQPSHPPSGAGRPQTVVRVTGAGTGTATIIIEPDTTVSLANESFALLTGFTISVYTITDKASVAAWPMRARKAPAAALACIAAMR